MNNLLMQDILLGKNMDMGASAPVGREFLEKQSAVLATPEGMRLAQELNGYRMGIIDSLVFSNEQGRTVMKKYQMDIEGLYSDLEAEKAKNAAQQQEEKIEAQNSRIKELEDELRKLSEALR